ncbi:MAG: hypothetical protein EOP83_08130 [Verrucomicrobiaceae bacterium]|nr:MAG: hypothetical protein EOP83_08130 [Verrucomicrobiaceae bacterium]
MIDDFTQIVLLLSFAALWVTGNVCHNLIRRYEIDFDPRRLLYDDFVMHTKYMVISRFIALIYMIGLTPLGVLALLRFLHWVGQP